VDVGPFIALAAVALLTTAGQVFWPSRTKRINRTLAAQPRARVQEAHGTVRLTGRVRRTGEPLYAPLSGRRCVAYEMFIYERLRPGGVGMSGWHRFVEQRQVDPFVVADESGEARVDTSGPFRLALVHDRIGTTGGFGPYPGTHRELGQFLESVGVETRGWLGFWKVFHYREGVIEEGELVSVGGACTREVDPTGDRADPRSPPERLVLHGTEALPLLISDGRAARSEHEG
jgi:hypothetical protein